jgi:alpha-D-ribose 1-methylphosphonate 5-phosphate C-P lyase
MHVKLYEDIARMARSPRPMPIPVKVEGRYVMDPSPIPKFDNPKLESAALQLFGAGREQRIYAVPPYTQGRQPRFRGHPFDPSKAPHPARSAGRRTAISTR